MVRVNEDLRRDLILSEEVPAVVHIEALASGDLALLVDLVREERDLRPGRVDQLEVERAAG